MDKVEQDPAHETQGAVLELVRRFSRLTIGLLGRDDESTIINPKSGDDFVVVMGVSGSGKTTFITRCMGETVGVGQDIQPYPHRVHLYLCTSFAPRKVWLVDMPSFDNGTQPDSDALREIAAWLTKSFSKHFNLRGILYFHKVTDTALCESGKKNLYIFKDICGQSAMNNVVMVTTMWETLGDEAEGMRRIQKLQDKDQLWGVLMRNGAKISHHSHDTVASALDILDGLLTRSDDTSQSATVTLAIQKEMVGDKKMLDQTAGGLALRRVFARQLKRLQQEAMATLIDIGKGLDSERPDLLGKKQREIMAQLDPIEQGIAEIRVDFKTLLRERPRRLELRDNARWRQQEFEHREERRQLADERDDLQEMLQRVRNQVEEMKKQQETDKHQVVTSYELRLIEQEAKEKQVAAGYKFLLDKAVSEKRGLMEEVEKLKKLSQGSPSRTAENTRPVDLQSAPQPAQKTCTRSKPAARSTVSTGPTQSIAQPVAPVPTVLQPRTTKSGGAAPKPYCAPCKRFFVSADSLRQHTADSLIHRGDYHDALRAGCTQSTTYQPRTSSVTAPATAQSVTSAYCEPCHRYFINKEALMQHEEDSPRHISDYKFHHLYDWVKCIRCDRWLANYTGYLRHKMDSPDH